MKLYDQVGRAVRQIRASGARLDSGSLDEGSPVAEDELVEEAMSEVDTVDMVRSEAANEDTAMNRGSATHQRLV